MLKSRGLWLSLLWLIIHTHRSLGCFFSEMQVWPAFRLRDKKIDNYSFRWIARFICLKLLKWIVSRMDWIIKIWRFLKPSKVGKVRRFKRLLQQFWCVPVYIWCVQSCEWHSRWWTRTETAVSLHGSWWQSWMGSASSRTTFLSSKWLHASTPTVLPPTVLRWDLIEVIRVLSSTICICQFISWVLYKYPQFTYLLPSLLSSCWLDDRKVGMWSW